MATTVMDRSAPEAATIAAPQSDNGRSRHVLLGAFIVAVVVSGYSIHAHAMWFDEIQAWNIARASHSLGDLVSNLRYEGHPPLWYLALYGLTRFTGDPRAMQVLAWLVAVAVNFILLFRSPFPMPARIALVAGYFVAFEYSVIARSYGLGLVLLLTGLCCLGRHHPRWGWTAGALVLLAWTSLAGAVLAATIALVAGGRWWSRQSVDGPAIAPLVTFCAAGAAVLTCIPPSDFHSFSLGIPNSTSAYLETERFVAALGGTWRGLVPIPLGVGRWNTDFIDAMPGDVWVQALVSIALVVLVAFVLRPYATAFALWIVGTIAFVIFSVVVVLPDRAHYAGAFFLLFLACTWLAYAPPGGGPPVPGTWSAGLPAVLVIVLAAQVVATVAILPDASARPFAPDRTLAEVAAAHGLERDVVSGQDFDAITMAGYLDTPIFSIARDEPMRFFVNDEREARGNIGLTPARVLCEAGAVARARERPVALVVDKEMPVPDGVRLLESTQGVRLYRVAPDAKVPTECTTSTS